MSSVMGNLSGCVCIGGGTADYLLVMAVEVIPTTMEFAGNLGMTFSTRDTWLGVSAMALAVALRLDRLLSRSQ